MRKNYLIILLVALILFGCKKDEVAYHVSINDFPNKRHYFENDKLDLTGLVISLYNPESRMNENVAFEDFKEKNLVTEPENGETLSLNNSSIKIYHATSGGYCTLDITIEPLNVTLKRVEKISETTFANPSACIVYSGNLYVATATKVYQYNFTSKQWSDYAETGVSSVVLSNFIKDDAWWFISTQGSAWSSCSFNFNTKEISAKKYFGGHDLSFNIGTLLENDELFIYDYSDQSNHKGKLFKYDFELDTIVKVSDNNGIQEYNVPRVSEWINLNGENYLLVGTGSIDVYKFNNSDILFEHLSTNYFRESYYSDVCFNYGNYIIYGLGGSSSIGSDGNYSSKWFDGRLRYYNPITNEGGEVKNKFYEGRYGTLSFKYNNEIYLLGGVAVLDSFTRPDQVINRNLLEKLIFE